MNVPEFKALFTDLFDDSNKFNVKFEIVDHVTTDNGVEVNAGTTRIGNNEIISISKQIFIDNGTLPKLNNMEIAKVILHECIHAYLDVKSENPDAGQPLPNIEGMTVQQAINAILNDPNHQHNFMIDHFIPTFTTIFSQLINELNTPDQLMFFQFVDVQPQFYTNPSSMQSWDWNNYYQFLGFQGLESTTFFQTNYAIGTNQHHLYSEYSTLGHSNLNFNMP